MLVNLFIPNETPQSFALMDERQVWASVMGLSLVDSREGKSIKGSLHILSPIRRIVSNAQRRLPTDLIIPLISNYFKGKWMHLAYQVRQ